MVNKKIRSSVCLRIASLIGFCAALVALIAIPAATQESRPNNHRQTKPGAVRWEGGMQIESLNGRDAAAAEVLVKLRLATAQLDQSQSLTQIGQAINASSIEPVGRGEIYLFRSTGVSVSALLSNLSARPDVEYAEPNYIVRANAVPNDARWSELWGLRNTGQNIQGTVGTAGVDVDAVPAWDLTTGSRKIVVGVIDTGIDYNHPDLAANMWSAPTAFSVVIGGQTIRCAAGTHGFNAIAKTCDPMDENNHGTHVAGTIGAVGNNGTGVAGVNWTTSLMGIRFQNADGLGTIADAMNAIEFAVQVKKAFAATNGADIRVLNNSWGVNQRPSESLFEQIKSAGDILFVVAAGNNPYESNYPAGYSAGTVNVLSVAASDNRDAIAPFSSGGEIAAPGVNVLSTVVGGGYQYQSGTSMAAPHVAGAAALLLSRCSLNVVRLKLTLLEQADVVSALSDKTFSSGRLNVYKALRTCTQPPAYKITDLNTLRNTRSYAYGVNNRGEVVGDVFDAPYPSNSRAFIYESGSMRRLGTLGGSEGAARGINDAGQVVGWSTTSSDRYTYAFLYRAGSIKSIGNLDPNHPANTSRAYDVNNSGQIVGESYVSGKGQSAFLFKDGKMQNLGSLSEPHGGIQATGINNLGQVVGGGSAWVTYRAWTHAFLHRDGTLQDLSTPFGDENSSFAAAVNDAGQIAASSYVGTGLQRALHAFIYSAGKWNDLGNLPGGTFISHSYWPAPYNAGTLTHVVSTAYDINNAGQVVGTACAVSKQMHAFVYKDGVMQDLNYLIPAASGWVLIEARSINDSGQIVGFGIVNGQEHAFLLTPVTPAANKPPTVTITNPQNGATFTAPANIALNANASDPDGVVSNVSFYANNQLLGTDTTSPYTFAWGSVAAGNYALTAVATDDKGAQTTSTIVNITVDDSTPTPSGALSGRDIGQVGLQGETTEEGGVYKIRASGADIYDRADSFRYVSRSLDGDGQIIARIASLDYTDAFAVAGVMIRESLAANAPHASMLVTPSGRAKFRYRVNNGATTASHGPGAGTIALPHWVKLERRNNVFTGSISGDGVKWDQIYSAAVNMNSQVQIGLAVAARNSATLCAATLDHVRIGAAGEELRVLASAADAYVQDGTAATNNFGTDAVLNVKRSATSTYNRYAYLKFDIGNLNGQIAGAKLRLFGRLAGAAGGDVPLGVYAVPEIGWNEASLTWNNKPPAGAIALSGVTIVNVTARWYEVDLTAFVRAEKAAGRGTISLVLKGTQPSNAYSSFNSREAIGAERPELEVATGQGFSAKINFQPAGAPVPDGYLADGGATFGDRGNGYSYGWNVDASAETRDRNASNSPDQRFDTLIFMQKYGAYTWELEVPNGTYRVRIVSGDASYYGFTYQTQAEGVIVVNGTSTSAARWIEGAATVVVSDGRLTLTNGPGATNNKLCFLEISSP